MANAPVLVAAVGMTLVILARQIDISIGSQFAICGGGRRPAGQDGPPDAAGDGGRSLAVGALMGALNGALVAGLGLPAIVVTLATMVVLREGLRWQTEGVWIEDLPAEFQWFGLGQAGGRVAIVRRRRWPCSPLFAWGLRHLAAGRASMPPAPIPRPRAWSASDPRRVVFATFVFMGGLTGLAALLTSIQFIDVQTSAGVGLELKVIAAVVVGGVVDLRRPRDARSAPCSESRCWAPSAPPSPSSAPRPTGSARSRARSSCWPWARTRCLAPAEVPWRSLRPPRERARRPTAGAARTHELLLLILVGAEIASSPAPDRTSSRWATRRRWRGPASRSACSPSP